MDLGLVGLNASGPPNSKYSARLAVAICVLRRVLHQASHNLRNNILHGGLLYSLACNRRDWLSEFPEQYGTQDG
jgi:hypothetical protein